MMRAGQSLSRGDLYRLAAAASTLSERLGGRLLPVAGPAVEGIARSRLERWCRLLAGGDEAQLAKRLAWDGRHLEAVLPFLGPTRLPETHPLPPWTDTLCRAIARASRSPISPTHRFLDPAQPLPFEEIFSPFVLTARQSLQRRGNAIARRLAPAARASLERQLLRSLAFLGAPSVQLELSAYRALRRTSLASLLATASGDRSRQLYEAFVGELLDGGLAALVQKVPFLARLLAEATDRWVEATAELLLRLDGDWQELRRRFAGGADPDLVAAAEAGLSDPHLHGRTVTALTFASGLKLAYKPRPVALEEGWSDLLSWLNGQGLSLALETVDVLSRPGYGWMRLVEPLPCRNEAEARRFYERAGMVLALVYALGGEDFHFENLVARGEQPVLVDLETLLQHRIDAGEDPAREAPADLTAARRSLDSVLGTGLLPHSDMGLGGGTFDLSGLGHVEEQVTPVLLPRWERVNTDLMEMRLEPGTTRVGPNAPLLDGRRLRPGDYVENIVAGFRTAYGLLAERREALLAPHGPVARLAPQPARFLLRSSQAYVSALRRALDPGCLRDGADFGIELDILCRPFLRRDERPRVWPLIRAEVQALERGDTPYFTAPSDSDSLLLGCGETVESLFARSAYQRAVARLRGLGGQDLERQVRLVRLSLDRRSTALPGL